MSWYRTRKYFYLVLVGFLSSIQAIPLWLKDHIQAERTFIEGTNTELTIGISTGSLLFVTDLGNKYWAVPSFGEPCRVCMLGAEEFP